MAISKMANVSIYEGRNTLNQYWSIYSRELHYSRRRVCVMFADDDLLFLGRHIIELLHLTLGHFTAQSVTVRTDLPGSVRLNRSNALSKAT